MLFQYRLHLRFELCNIFRKEYYGNGFNGVSRKLPGKQYHDGSTSDVNRGPIADWGSIAIFESNDKVKVACSPIKGQT